MILWVDWALLGSSSALCDVSWGCILRRLRCTASSKVNYSHEGHLVPRLRVQPGLLAIEPCSSSMWLVSVVLGLLTSGFQKALRQMVEQWWKLQMLGSILRKLLSIISRMDQSKSQRNLDSRGRETDLTSWWMRGKEFVSTLGGKDVQSYAFFQGHDLISGL